VPQTVVRVGRGAFGLVELFKGFLRLAGVFVDQPSAEADARLVSVAGAVDRLLQRGLRLSDFPVADVNDHQLR